MIYNHIIFFTTLEGPCLLFLLLLHFLLLFLLFPSLTAKLHHQRFPEPSVSMNQLQGILGSFTICQRKTNTQNKSRSLWSKVKWTAV